MTTLAETKNNIVTAINELLSGNVESYRIGNISFTHNNLDQLREMLKTVNELIKEEQTMEERVCEF